MYNYIIISPFFVFKLVRCNKRKERKRSIIKEFFCYSTIAFKDETQHWLYQPNSLCR